MFVLKPVNKSNFLSATHSCIVKMHLTITQFENSPRLMGAWQGLGTWLLSTSQQRLNAMRTSPPHFLLPVKIKRDSTHNTFLTDPSCHSTQTPSQVVYATTVTALFHNINQRHTHLLGITELYSRILIQISQKLSGFRTSNAHNPLFHHRQCQILCS